MNKFKRIWDATTTVLQPRNYRVALVLVSLTIFAIYVLLPVRMIPGNSLLFQLSIFTPTNYLLMVVLALLTALLVLMQIFTWTHSARQQDKQAALGQGGLGGLASFTSALFGTAACSSCIAVLFGFLGSSTVFFLLDKQVYVLIGAIALLLISLYFSAAKVVGVCVSCEP